VAGIPCQPSSVAGKRDLEDDPRDLWPATRQILRDVRPEYFFLENVPGFLVPGKRTRHVAPARRVIQELAEDGWDEIEWLTLQAAQVGAPHKRERFFLLAHRVWDGIGGQKRQTGDGRGVCQDGRSMADAQGSVRPGERRNKNRTDQSDPAR